jgi:hypothetical protein
MKNRVLDFGLFGSDRPTTPIYQLNPVTQRIADWQFTLPTFYAGDLSSWDLGPAHKSPGEADGTMGWVYLGGLNAVVDCEAGVMWIMPGRRPG